MAWFAKMPHHFGGKLTIYSTFDVAADGRLSPQPEIQDVIGMKSLPRLYVFRVEEDTDPADAELAGVVAPEPEVPETPQQKAAKTRAANKAAKETSK